MTPFSRISLVATLAVVTMAAAGADDPQRWHRRTPVVDVFEKCRDAVVNINTRKTVRVRSLRRPSIFDEIFETRPRTRTRRITSIGSGIVVHESGYIVTNAHVVSQAIDVRVTFADDRTLSAEIVAVDSEHDLAVLKVSSRRDLAYLKLGRSDDIMIGETVIAIGNPLGLQHSVTAGIISALDRELSFSQNVSYRGLIQTDASINPGNSGGPLLNVNAELIGINTAIRGDAQNIGFAIPVDRLWSLLPVMLDVERHKRVAFGLEVSGPEAKVIRIRPDSPAAKTDLRPGDRLVAFNGEPLRDGIDYYVHLLGQKPGNDVRLTARRGAETVSAIIPLVAVPPPDGRELAAALLGVRLAKLPAQLRREFELPRGVGLVVEGVDRRGPADRAGIEKGDILLRLDRVSVPSFEDVGLLLERVQPGSHIIVEGFRLHEDPPFRWEAAIRTRQP